MGTAAAVPGSLVAQPVGAASGLPETRFTELAEETQAIASEGGWSGKSRDK